MHKAIGLITCASVMAVSLYLFSGGDSSRTLSAQTDSETGEGYGAVARRFLQDARDEAQKGNIAEARRLAGTAASLCSDWSKSEQSPDQFLKSLNTSSKESAADASLFDASESEPDADFAPDSAEAQEPAEVNPFEEAVASGDVAENAGGDATQNPEQPAAVTSRDLLKKKQAQRLIKEARHALASGDTALARSRALQARQLQAPWGLWDDRPEHVLADLDKKSKTSTFLPGGRATAAAPEIRSKDTEHDYQQATALLSQARAAMDAGKLSEAQQLADEAAAFDVAYGIFEDSPTMVSRDIKRLAGSGPEAFKAFTSTSNDAAPDADQARQLLREAREALTQGRLTVPRQRLTGNS